MKYKLQMMHGQGPRDGFFIIRPDKKMILDVNPVTIVKELNRLLRDIKSLEVVRDRLLENALIVKEAGNKKR
jgi:hypothetical protein